MTTMAVDLTDAGMFQSGEHHAVFDHLRRHQPVHENVSADGSRFFSLVRHEDVLWAYRNHTLLGSSRGAVLGGSFASTDDTAAGKMLVSSDLPRHRMLKRIIAPWLSSAVAQRVRQQVTVLVERALDRAQEQGGCDFAQDVAPELPAGALMTIMGVTHAQAHELIRLTRRMIGYGDPSLVEQTGDPRLDLLGLQADIFEYFSALIAERRREDDDSLVGSLTRAELNGSPITEDEILYNCMNVAVGGNETSSYTACAGVDALSRDTDQYDLLLAQPDLLPGAIEEMLRYSSTNAYVQRVAYEDVERHGVVIRKGDSVALWNCSANRDEEVFADPHRFDIRRDPKPHLTFGAGLHRCAGAPVGLAEIDQVLQALIRRGLRLRTCGPVRRLRSNFILGITHLPMEAVR